VCLDNNAVRVNQDRNATKCLDRAARLFHQRSVPVFQDRSAGQWRDKLPDRNVPRFQDSSAVLFPDNNVPTFRDKFVNPSPGEWRVRDANQSQENSAHQLLSKYRSRIALMYQDNSAALYRGNSASLFQDSSAVLDLLRPRPVVQYPSSKRSSSVDPFLDSSVARPQPALFPQDTAVPVVRQLLLAGQCQERSVSQAVNLCTGVEGALAHQLLSHLPLVATIVLLQLHPRHTLLHQYHPHQYHHLLGLPTQHHPRHLHLSL
jgi:hypothetical protein